MPNSVHSHRLKNGPTFLLAPALAAALLLPTQSLQAALSDGLVSYWPLEAVQGGKTPDKVSGYDMNLRNLTAADLVAGKNGMCFQFSNARQTLLSYVSSANDELPINKHPAFTIAFWANVTGTGQTDLRLFSEGSTTSGDPLFNLGTDNTGGSNLGDIFFRQASLGTVNHIKTVGEPFDGTWRHITFVQREDGSRTFYIDGIADALEIPAKTAGTWNVNTTTIGGILRASPSHWVTGLIDDVILWKRALTDAEITQVKTEGLVSLFPPETEGLISHWPLDEVLGGKTPDVVSGYDMNLHNLTAADLVTGRIGKTFQFSNARQTLLSYVSGPNDLLPINKHPALTIVFWANVTGTGQTDLRLFSEGSTTSGDPLFNLGTDNTGGSNLGDIFFRQTGLGTVNHLKTVGEPFDGTWRHITFVQREDGSRTFYIDGVADALEIPAKAAGAWNVNTTTIGGILRASASHWVSGLIDEVALWNRALSEPEINTVKTSGVPKAFVKQQPLELKSFLADFSTVAAGDKVVLRWEGSKDASYSISPDVGDVNSSTQFGVGTREITVNNSTTFTLTATRGQETLTRTLDVKAQAGVATGWHLLETFNNLSGGVLGAQNAWLATEGVWNLVDVTGDKWLGYGDGNDLTAIKLNSYVVPEGQRGTLFFRVRTQPVPAGEPIPAITLHVGITERAIRFNGDFNANVGPYVRFERLADFGPETDIMARNGVATGIYEGWEVGAIQPGQIYNVWIDFENRPFDIVDGVQNGGDRYSVHLQQEGGSRRTLFNDFMADRDAINIDPALGAPLQALSHVFVSAPGTPQGNNNALVDDFFITVGSYSSTVPIPVDDAPPAPSTITITGTSLNATTGRFTLTWGSADGFRYNVQRRSPISGAWNTIATGVAATGASTSYTDDANLGNAFYRVVYQP